MGALRTLSVGRYELLIELAKGGMAELFLGRLHGVAGFSKLVAIKRILPHLAEDKLFVEMFLNEGRIASQLAHPNVCQVYELGEADGELFLAMEYLDGVTWDAVAKQVPRDATTLRLTAGVIAQACEGLHYAHELRDVDGSPTPVIHRDVSPQNLFLTVDGVCKVLDFGVSKMMKDGPRTRSGVLKGKLPYMSPEQIQGEPLDARSDVFALGVVTWEAMAGTSLFDRETDFLIWKAITEESVPPLAPRGFPPELDAVLASALARDRNLRFRSARAFGEALRNVAEKVGGAYAPAEIATVVKARCGAALAARQAEVASVVTRRRSRPSEPAPADTIEERAGETVSLRTDPAQAVRRAAEPRNRWPWIAAALGVVAVVAVIVAISRGRNEPAAPTAPVTSLATTPTPPPDADAWAAARPLVDEAKRQMEEIEDHVKRPALGESLGRLNERLEQVGKRVEGVRDVAKSLASAPTATPRTTPKPPVPRDPPPREPSTPREPPPPSEPPPRVVTDPNAQHGTFSIDSTPYATIYLDGNRLGDTPLFKKPVAPGKHVVRAVTEDGREKVISVEVAPGKHVSAGRLTW